MKQGEQGDHFFILEQGECVASISQADGGQQDVKTYRKGEVFGEKALLEKAPRSASIRVVLSERLRQSVRFT